MRNNASFIFSLFLVLGDFLALLAAFVAAYVLRVTLDPRPLIESIGAVSYLYAFVAILPLWIIVHGVIGLYSQHIYEKRFTELGRLFVGSFLGILVVIGYDFISPDALFPARLVPVYGLVLAFLFLVAFRTLARLVRTALFSYNVGVTNLLIVGDTPLSLELISQLIEWRNSGYRVLGVVSQKQHAHETYPDLAVFDTFAEAIENIGLDNIHSIIQTELYATTSSNDEILTAAQENHIAYRFVPGNAELFVGNIQVDLFQSVPVIAVHQTALLGWGRVVKRLFDLGFGGLVLLLALPFMLLIALAIKLSGSGTVFFRQTRLTRFNNEFRVFKFRTQYQKYDGTTPEEAFDMMGKPELATKYRNNGDFLARDPRVTPLGRFLRAASLDELPQLFNVIAGDLSLVGPRALIPQELSLYNKRHAILSVKSGLTGLAQVSGRRNISFDERRKLDLYYVQNWSFWSDIVILVKTVKAVVLGQGAK